MKRLERAFPFLVFLALSFGLASYFSIYIQSSRFSILRHSFQLSPLFFILIAGVFLLFASTRILMSKRTLSFPGRESSPSRHAMLPVFPLFLFLLTPLLLGYYTTREDLKTRLHLLALFVFIATFYLMLAEYNERTGRFHRILEKGIEKFSSFSPRKKLLALFLGAFLAYQGATFVLVSQGTTFSGDEPNYLMTTHSLLKDGDINLANNYAQQDYFSFYSREENPRLRLGIYGRYGKKGPDTIYPINLPGVSALMLPFYWLSQLFTGRWLTFLIKGSLSVWAALLGLQVYLYSRDVWGKERLSLALWGLYSFTAPVFFYAAHLYPEVPIALFSLAIFRKVTCRARLTGRSYLFLGFLLGAFPWFGLKFNLIFWPLLLVSVYHILKTQKTGKNILLFLAPPVFSMALFYYFLYYLYGTFSPLSVYEGVITPDQIQAFKEAALGIPLLARVDTFLDYFLDQRDGLLLYSPLYLFAFLGLVEVFRRARRDFWAFLFISLPFILNYAFFTHRQGHSPQARVLVPISWIGAIALGYFIIHNKKKIFTFFFGFFGFASFVFAGILLRHPQFLYQPTTHEFTHRPGELFVHLSNLHFFLPPFLPSFIKVDNTKYLPNYVWVFGILGIVISYAFLKGSKEIHETKKRFRYIFTGSLLAASFLLWVLFPRDALYPSKTIHYSQQKALGFYLFPMGKGMIAKESGDFYLHIEKPYKFLFRSKTPLEKVKVVFGSEKGEFEVEMDFFDIPLYSGRTGHEKKELVIRPPAHYPVKGQFLYEINLNLKHLSSESMLVAPYLFQVIPLKE